MKKKLDIIATIKDGVALALVNYVSILATVVLYVVSIFIPYINVGTTIAIASLPAEMAKGKVVNPIFIFDSKYRRNMGEFLILEALKMGALWVAYCFLLIPGMVIAMAWRYAEVLFVDKNKSPMEALRESNDITYGNKWRIFWIEFLLVLALAVAVLIIIGLFSLGHVEWLETIGSIIVAILCIFVVPAMMGVEAVIYKRLTEPEAPEQKPEPEKEA